MTDLPCVASPNHPLGFSRGKAGYGRTVDFKTSRLIQAMICGIEQEITVTSPELHAVAPDTVTLPAGRPLTLRQAARACRMKVKRALALQATQEFQSAFREAVAAYNESMESGNLAAAIAIRDDPTTPRKIKLKAIDSIRRPLPMIVDRG